MKISIQITPVDIVLSQGISVNVARKGESLSENILGKFAKKKGVYVILNMLARFTG